MGCRGSRAAAVAETAFAEYHAAKARVLGARWWTTKMKANLVAAAWEEIRPDGEFLDTN